MTICFIVTLISQRIIISFAVQQNIQKVIKHRYNDVPFASIINLQTNPSSWTKLGCSSSRQYTGNIRTLIYSKPKQKPPT